MNGEQKMRYIYLTTNLLNAKDYIGQRKIPDGEEPETDKYLGSGSLLMEDIKKYGRKNFRKEILVFGNFTQQEIDELERKYIKEYREKGKAKYNISNGGHCSPYEFMSEEQKEEFCKKLSIAHIGQKHTKKQDEEISKKFSGCGNPFYGKKHTDETRKKMRDNHKGTLGKKWSEGTKKLIGEGNSKSVICLELEKVFPSIKKASEVLNINNSAISQVVKGKRKTAGKLHWKYA
jgi:group I intron endonuclease